jgi:hypothetical protein
MKFLGIEFKAGAACAWCEKEARQKGVKLEYDPNQVSHSICPDHKTEQVALVEQMKMAAMLDGKK